MTGELLRKLIKKHGLTQKELAQKLTNAGYNCGNGIKVAAISKYILGQRKISSDFIKATLEVLGENDANIFFSGKPLEVAKIKIVGSVSCGGALEDGYQRNDEYTVILADENRPTLRAVIANGDSMYPMISDKDIVIYDSDNFNVKPQNGDLVVYFLNNENACKIFVEKKNLGIIEFKPINQDESFKTTSIRIDNEVLMENLSIYKVVKIIKNPEKARQNLKLVGEM